MFADLTFRHPRCDKSLNKTVYYRTVVLHSRGFWWSETNLQLVLS